jgi:hypothetical protein
MKRPIARIRSLKTLRSGDNDYGIYSIDELHKLLNYERIRSTRTGINFSFITFSSDEMPSPRQTKQLVKRLRANVRLTDHIGWFTSNSIGVVLPLVQNGDAELFVSKVLGPLEHTCWRYSIYALPNPTFVVANQETGYTLPIE